jgi:hypothetical protein
MHPTARLLSRRVGGRAVQATRSPSHTARAASMSSSATHDDARVLFGPFSIPVSEQVFVSTELSVGLVNLKPVVPGTPPPQASHQTLTRRIQVAAERGQRGTRQAMCW